MSTTARCVTAATDPDLERRQHENRVRRGREPQAIEEKEHRRDRRLRRALHGAAHDNDGTAAEAGVDPQDPRLAFASA
jgi:hypothetical protein